MGTWARNQLNNVLSSSTIEKIDSPPLKGKIYQEFFGMFALVTFFLKCLIF